MRADAKMFSEQAILILDKAGKSITKLSKQSGVPRSTLYRAIYQPKQHIDRETAEKIATGLGASIEFKGRSVRLYLENRGLGVESRGHAVDSMSEEELELERRIRILGDRLRTVDIEIFDAAEELVNLILSMEKDEINVLRDVHKMLTLGGNKDAYVRMLKALGELVTPYEQDREVESFAEG